MDHSLDDSLNLDSAMGVDFEPSGDQVVSQVDISLDASSHEANLPMEFESIEEQPLMDTENEQIIGYSDDQFSLQDYDVQHQEEETGANTTVVTSELSMSQSQSDTMIDIQFDPQAFTSSALKTDPPAPAQPKFIAVKATTATPPRFTAIRKEPRQVAIAPKPLKQVTLAPAPRHSLVKKVSIAGVVQGAAQGKTVLAQIGKQLVMVPTSGGTQKIKLVTSAGGVPSIQYIRTNQRDQAQLIATKSISGTPKPILTKYIVQGQPTKDSSNQPAVITKLMNSPAPTRIVTMHQKTVPISMPHKVFVSSPTKQTVRITKKSQFVEIKSPTPKLMPNVQPGGGTKKVVITASPAPNVIYKTTAPVKNQQQVSQLNKDGIITVHQTGQRTQLHQINVPGKGIQYIRLVSAPRAAPAAPPRKTIVLTDNKGNVIQMAAEKVQSGQPPPLVITGASLNKLGGKPQQKLVRIAPVGSKPAIAASQSIVRSSQSLLAPLSPKTKLREPSPPPEADSKAALQALLAEADAQQQPLAHQLAGELEVEFESRQSGEEKPSSHRLEAETPGRGCGEAADPLARGRSYRETLEQPLIVIPNYLKPRDSQPDHLPATDESQNYNNFEAQGYNSFQAPPTPQALSESELGPNELGLRPRKACNCTKSQCLKLYCDCFANGEFCNRCNCNNCHNNLENEELRQKAIRGCLDRNPNAFRPKIGKAKSGGPEIVRRHNKGCNCKRSGCLKNYCECYEAKIACTAMCKCVGCRNVEETLDRRRRERDPRDHVFRPPALPHINFMTTEVIEAVCQCLIAAAASPAAPSPSPSPPPDPVRDVIDEFSRCLQDIINAAHHAAPQPDDTHARGPMHMHERVERETTPDAV